MRDQHKRKTSLITKILIVCCIFLAGFSLYSFVGNNISFSTEKEKSEVYKEVEKIKESTKASAREEEAEESSSIEEPDPELELNEEQKRTIQLEEQISHTDVYNSMTNERLDRGTSTEILGNIVSPKIGLDVEFWQGVGYKTGAVTHTTIASDFGAEYALFFEGIDKISKDKVFLALHRTIKSPDSSFGLIHEEFGSYEISGDALGDLTKDKDGALGLYGYYTQIPKAA